MSEAAVVAAIAVSKNILSVTSSPKIAGSTSPSGSNSYTTGKVVSVTATVTNTGYVFDHWELDGVNQGSTNPISVTMSVNHTLVAFFAILSNQSSFATASQPITNPMESNPVFSDPPANFFSNKPSSESAVFTHT